MSSTEHVDAVALDGPAGAGKSTVAKRVAEALGYTYVDTGAMYRTVALAALRQGVEMENAEAMGTVARACEIDFDATGAQVFLNGEDVSAVIRSAEVTSQTKYAASAPPVRTELVARQQAIASKRPVVMEGRDITTIVLANARWKFYLDASVDCRARRRQGDLEQQGESTPLEEIAADIEARDQSDFEREVGPLKRTDEQIYLDTSELSADQVVARIVETVQHG